MEKSDLLGSLLSKEEAKRNQTLDYIRSAVAERIKTLTLADKFLQHLELRPGVIPAVERDTMNPALIPREEGTVRVEDKGNRLFFEEIQFSALVSMSVREEMQRSYAILDRLMESAPRTIAKDMDKVFVNMISYTPNKVPWKKRIRTLFTGGLSYQTLLEGVLDVEKWRLPCKALLVSSEVHRLNQKAFTQFSENNPDIEVVKVVDIDIDSVYFLSEPHLLGYVADRNTFDLFIADQFVNGQSARGWLTYRLCGMLISNSRGVAKLPVTSIWAQARVFISRFGKRIVSLVRRKS